VIVGAVRDPLFGPLVMFGSGGIEVEGMQDVAFCLAPVAPGEAAKMIERTRAGHRLRGFRSVPPADQEAVLDAILKLSRLVEARADIQEIEINPLRVFGRGQGVSALDVRVSRRQEGDEV
jgi:acyl-CoA synthetase (NDP forming)